MSLLTKLGPNRLFTYARKLKIQKSPNHVIPFCNDNWQSLNKSSLSAFKYLLIFTSGYVTYKIIKNGTVFPSVAASTLNLNGRKKQFNFVSDVVEKCGAGVVYIEIRDKRGVDLFGPPRTISNGSGFIIKEDGLILTNAHVVANKPHCQVWVKLHNGDTYTGHVEHVDLNSDLATIRISAKNLSVIPLGNSSELQPGEFVVAIGSPLSLSNSVSFGVISSTNRDSDQLGLRGKDMVYLQTDAAITFGNSGGPLVDLEGNAIGINSLKVTAGISFAIPIDYVKAFLKNAEKTKKVGKPATKKYMGISMLTLTPQIILELQKKYEAFPLNVKGGILVWKVILGSPAYR